MGHLPYATNGPWLSRNSVNPLTQTTRLGASAWDLSSRDPRVSASRMKLLSALGFLLASHAFVAVTASMVAQQAGVSRATFYRHFADVEDLGRFALRELIQQVPTISLSAAPLRDKALALVASYFSHIDVHRSVFTGLLRKDGGMPGFSELMLSSIQAEISRDLTTLGAPEESKDLMATFIASAAVSAAVWWLAEPSRPSLGSVVSRVERLIVPGLQTFFEAADVRPSAAAPLPTTGRRSVL